MVHVLELTTADQFQALETDWNELLAEAAEANYFQSFEWFSLCLQHWSECQQFRVYCLADGDELIGLLPMLVLDEPHRLCTARVLMPPLDNWGTKFAPIQRPGSDILTPLLAHFRHAKSDWEVCSLRWFDERRYGETIRGGLEQLRWKPVVSEVQHGAEIRFTDATWNEYLSSRSSKWRSNIRRVRRKLEREHGRVDFRRWRGALSVQDQHRVWEHCRQVAELSWQARADSGVAFSNPAAEDLLLDLHATACQRGQLDVGLLFVDDAPVAFNYNLIQQGNISGLRMGFDPAYRPYGVGLLLTVFLIEDSFERGDKSFDLGVDYLDYKRCLATHFYETRRYDCYKSHSIRAQALKCQQALRSWWSTEGAHHSV